MWTEIIFKQEDFYMRMIKGLALVAICVSVGNLSSAGESPLRGADLSQHFAGPKVTAESVTGKVLLIEYGGAN